jgi:glycosyltransferase involved in cell wall biosynthesis
MNFGINALGLINGGKRGGVANYIYHLTTRMARLESEHRLTVYVRSDYHDLDRLDNHGLALRRVPIPSNPRGVQFAARVYTEQLLLARRARDDELDVLHFPDHVAAIYLRPNCRQVLTVHDLTVFSHASTHSTRTRLYLQHFLPPSVQAADRIICISQSTADDLQKRFGVPTNKIDVVLLAAAAPYVQRPSSAYVESLRRFGAAPGAYLLYLGTIEPRKNVEGLILAYAVASARTQCPPLIVAGRMGRFSGGIEDLPRHLGVEGRVLFPGFVTEDEAVALYSGARAFVYPSHYEGFGLPVLEAMACGAPVITSNVSSMPEVAGGAALLVSPDDVEGLADSICRLVQDDALCHSLAERGKSRAEQFSWDRCARETLDVYSRTASEGPFWA